MDITTTTLGFVGLGAVAVIAIVLAWQRRVTASRFVARSPLTGRPRSRNSLDWFASDPVLFTGSDIGSADCSAGSDGGGGGCD